MDKLVEALKEHSIQCRLLEKADLGPYLYDGLRRYRGFERHTEPSKLVVVYPKSTDEVVYVVRYANMFKVPIVPVGGMTGLMGGAIPLTESIMLDMRKMNRVLEVRPEDRLVVCEAGITLAELDERLSKEGLMLGHDPWTKQYATVGGSIATNGMGYTAASYGSMRRQVLGLEVVLPTAEVLGTRYVEDSSTGPSLVNLFIGSEGVLGVITKAVLRVYPIPEKRMFLGYRFPSFEEGFRALQRLSGVGLTPTSLEYGEVLDEPSDPLGDYESELFIMVEGVAEEVDAKTRRISEIVERCGGVKTDDTWPHDFWRRRHEVAQRFMNHVLKGDIDRLWGDNIFDFIHVSLPISKVLAYRRLSGEVLSRNRFLIVDRGVWRHPENFSIAYVGQARDNALKMLKELLATAHSLGGSMEYCHGVGIRLADMMAYEHGVPGFKLLQRIKNVLDPNNIMNPGKLGF